MTYHSGNQMIDTELLFEKSHVQPGMHVADFGCGRTGHIVFPISPIIGEKGVVYAVDILKDALIEINKRAKLQAIHNVHTIWTNLELFNKTSIPRESVDIGFLINMLFENEKKEDVLKEINRLMKNKSRLVVVDWFKKGPSMGPNEDKFVSFDELKKWASKANFIVQEEFKAGPYHWGMVLYKNV
jgi:ubiquinone/menaquinone biosynthesis C-methylase UbiE